MQVIGGAIVLDYHKWSEMTEIADSRVKLGGRYVVPGTQLNLTTSEIFCLSSGDKVFVWSICNLRLGFWYSSYMDTLYVTSGSLFFRIYIVSLIVR